MLSEVRRLKLLEEENSRLKRLVADIALDLISRKNYTYVIEEINQYSRDQ